MSDNNSSNTLASASEQMDLPTQADKAIAEGGAYEVLNDRLQEQAKLLRQKSEQINTQRLDEFGQQTMDIVGRVRIRTENNCIARDIVRVGDCLLFGYNVFIGLRPEAKVEDVFSLYRLVEQDEGFETEQVSLTESFLAEQSFLNDFNELYTYYKNTRLIQLAIRDGKLLASFQIGERVTDIRVFRWKLPAGEHSISKSEIQYIDNRGERDIALPLQFDFAWKRTERDMVVNGKHPHINILDKIFVESINGDITIKIENNTETGLGIYSESVIDKTQSLDDAHIEYAQVGSLILLKILPYREEDWRYFVYNPAIQKVQNIPLLGLACIQLPEDHGLIFPGGYYLQNGEYKTFEQPMDGMHFKRAVRSPNGEDIQYVFYHPEEGKSALFTYNMISRTLQNPIFGHGYARFEDGRMVIFITEDNEPKRVHPLQIWQTPFYSEEFAAHQPTRNTFMGRIGNAELVRGISDCYGLVKAITEGKVSSGHYSELCQEVRRLFDSYHWLNDDHSQGIASILRQISETSEQMLDEYEKVMSIRRTSEKALEDAEVAQKSLLSPTLLDDLTSVPQCVRALNQIALQRGTLLTIRTYRYINIERIGEMEKQLLEAQAKVESSTSDYLASPEALKPFHNQLVQINQTLESATRASDLNAPRDELKQLATELDTLSQLIASLPIDDAIQRTVIIDAISEIYANLNQTTAKVEKQRNQFGATEMVAQFSAQTKLLEQSIAQGLAQSIDPSACDEQLSRLLVQLEELESQFGDHEQFLGDILTKRDSLITSFEAHRQQLLDERQRKAANIHDAALRILESISRRATRFKDERELNAFFASDSLIIKFNELRDRLNELQESVKADDLDAKLKNTKDQSLRVLRDKNDLFSDEGNTLKLGKHVFSVNTQPLDLTLLPKNNEMYLNLTGTDFLERVDDEELNALQEFWNITTISESESLYRAEYLAGIFLNAINNAELDLTFDELIKQSNNFEQLCQLVRDFATPRYQEGYQKGVHDHDAAKILQALLPRYQQAGLLIYSARARALASFFWSFSMASKVTSHDAVHSQDLLHSDNRYSSSHIKRLSIWGVQAKTSFDLKRLLGHSQQLEQLQNEISHEILDFTTYYNFAFSQDEIKQSAEYLVEILAKDHPVFCVSQDGKLLVDTFTSTLKTFDIFTNFDHALDEVQSDPFLTWQLIENALEALHHHDEKLALKSAIPDAITLFLFNKKMAISNEIIEGKRKIEKLEVTKSEATASCAVELHQVDLGFTVSGLIGDHGLIKEGALAGHLDDFFARLRVHQQYVIPQYERLLKVRQSVLQSARDRLRIEEFKAKPLSAFVRNKLINDIYLPLIGDNLAKQMGTVGQTKRSDLMGLLMLISPPGYGKTTLIEYVANRLGLIFMKINGPALGHEVRSLDPAQAPDANSQKELEKLNLALEMGNNVLLYLDDIQHTNPEFLQKFISLCDGTRRIEGIWNGKTKTYDMRGKKFCIVMAGNPYTETGEIFNVPDMLANRADIYNLGDVLGGKEDIFALSYIENCLTSHAVLAPLATRSMDDFYQLVNYVQHQDHTQLNTNGMSYAYNAAELNEITNVLKHLLSIRDLILQVNQQYILSAAQDDAYRVEPPFKLQGSYRNMNKLAEKVSAVMNQQELQQLVTDHYLGESQLLKSGSEENLLKLAELRGIMSKEEQQRWDDIKSIYLRQRENNQANTGNRLVEQLTQLVDAVTKLQTTHH